MIFMDIGICVAIYSIVLLLANLVNCAVMPV